MLVSFDNGAKGPESRAQAEIDAGKGSDLPFLENSKGYSFFLFFFFSST